MKKKEFWYKLPPFTFSVVALLTLFYFTLLPQPLPPFEPPMLNFDKVVHVVMMFLVSTAIMLDFKRRERQCELSLSTKIYITIATIALGAFIELAQGSELIHRGCDVLDGVANAVGCIMAFFVAPPLLRKLLK